ncbi:unnamed protein product [Cercospora beticola]|nr:unnamed protein product [Cercospora beticola]
MVDGCLVVAVTRACAIGEQARTHAACTSRKCAGECKCKWSVEAIGGDFASGVDFQPGPSAPKGSTAHRYCCCCVCARKGSKRSHNRPLRRQGATRLQPLRQNSRAGQGGGSGVARSAVVDTVVRYHLQRAK